MLSDSRGSIPSTPMTMTFLPKAPRDVTAAAEPVIPHAQSRGTAGGRESGRAFQHGPAVDLRDGCIIH